MSKISRCCLFLILYISKQIDQTFQKIKIQNCSSTAFTTWEFKARGHTNDGAVKAGGSHRTDIGWYQGRKDVYLIWRVGGFDVLCLMQLHNTWKKSEVLKPISFILVLYFITLSICKYIVIVKMTLLNLPCDTITLTFAYAAVNSGVRQWSWSGFYKLS